MSENKQSMAQDWIDDDDAPDLSAPEWKEKMDAAPVRRGRPPSSVRKVSTTIRLDPDVLEHFQQSGDGWQTRINDALRAAAGLR